MVDHAAKIYCCQLGIVFFLLIPIVWGALLCGGNEINKVFRYLCTTLRGWIKGKSRDTNVMYPWGGGYGWVVSHEGLGVWFLTDLENCTVVQLSQAAEPKDYIYRVACEV